MAYSGLGRHVEAVETFKDALRLQPDHARAYAELGDAYDFSVSSGSVVANADELDEIDELLARTDQRMYKAKRERRRESADTKAMAETS
jgi:GGDEF domain-containing protein